MSFTASPRTARFTGLRGCHGLNHHDAGTAGHCDGCGAPVFKGEKGQLTDPGHGGSGGEVFYCWRAHHCDPDRLAARDLRDAEALVDGRFPKLTQVEVFKGRKVPVGTVGIVRYVGDGYNDGDIRLGLAVAGQDKLMYVDSRNCRVSPEALAVAQALVAADQAARQARVDRIAALEAEFRQVVAADPQSDRPMEILTEIQALKANA